MVEFNHRLMGTTGERNLLTMDNLQELYQLRIASGRILVPLLERIATLRTVVIIRIPGNRGMFPESGNGG